MATRTERKELSRLRRRQEDRVEVPEPDPTRGAKRRGKTPKIHPFGLEYRVREGALLSMGWAREKEWGRCWKWYETAARRDTAMAALNRSTLFEYRPMERYSRAQEEHMAAPTDFVYPGKGG